MRTAILIVLMSFSVSAFAGGPNLGPHPHAIAPANPAGPPPGGHITAQPKPAPSPHGQPPGFHINGVHVYISPPVRG